MTETLGADPTTGWFSLSPAAWRALLDHPGSAQPKIEPVNDLDAPTGASVLEAAGLLSDGQLLPSLARALEAVRAPSCRLSVSSRGLEARAWLDVDLAALLVPTEPELLELGCVPTAFVPDVLARLVELEPRPVPQDPPFRLAPGRLAHLMAAPDDYAVLPGEGLQGRYDDAVARRLMASVTRHWRIEAQYTKAEPRADSVRAVEAIDTPGGLWLLEAAGGGVRLRPTTPTRVWRLLTLLFPIPQEGVLN